MAPGFRGELQGQDYGAMTALEITAGPGARGQGIALSWAGRSDLRSCKIYRTVAGGTGQTSTLPLTAAGYDDPGVPAGTMVEYRLAASPANTALPVMYGHCLAGREVPLAEDNGGLLLVVTEEMAAAAGREIQRLVDDATGEGWRVTQWVIPPAATVASVKAGISAAWQGGGRTLKSVLLIGHVPVPYSGLIYPDGHPEHRGAWPCDGYYGDMDEALWKDVTVNFSAARAENTNVPGDGKFDASTFPSALELAVGRLDFSRLPAFAPLTEADLLRRYLEKNHAWRTGALAVEPRALVDDNLPTFAEGFSAATRRAACALAGAGSVLPGDYLTPGPACVFGAGIGYGSYDSISGVAGTSQLPSATTRAAFNLLMGSYSGDWDTTNNLIRAMTAAPGASVAAWWSGRPNIPLFLMALGQTAGECTRRAMSPGGTTYLAPGASACGVHLGLMGDPTLRLNSIAPVPQVSAVCCGGRALIEWQSSPAAGVAGYAVFRAEVSGAPFVRCHGGLLQAGLFVDVSCPGPGCRYMVRAVRLETTASGTWWNGSTGRIATPSDSAAGCQFDAWAEMMIPAPAARGDEADPDADGLPNLQEYLAGSDPMLPGCDDACASRGVAGNLELTFSMIDGLTAATFVPEASPDMVTWTPVADVQEVSRESGRIQCRACVPAAEARGFLRLRPVRH